ncbi:MAG: DUF3035 domain-containing protein [Roseovarius sp.]|nr:DUF3035 domain-containing protein [Roseovarius sp.]MCY4292072.1 DUF3035 domain-containing protein [Roseovarius sp.]
MILPRVSLFLALMLALSACGTSKNEDGEVRLTRLKSTGEGPDEFAVSPRKPLEQPEDLGTLPRPTPGTANLADPTPKADAILALGGNPDAIRQKSIPGRDASLVKYADRHGVDENIRTVLAAEDVEIRRRYGRVNVLRIFPTSDYNSAYTEQWLNAYEESERLKGKGINTPSSPPSPE